MNLFTKQKQTYRYQKQTFGSQRRKVAGRDKSGAWDEHSHIATYKQIDNQQGPAVQHRELYSILSITYLRKESVKRMNMCVCITGLLCCIPETNTTLYINYTPIFFLIKNNKRNEESREQGKLRKQNFQCNKKAYCVGKIFGKSELSTKMINPFSLLL